MVTGIGAEGSTVKDKLEITDMTNNTRPKRCTKALLLHVCGQIPVSSFDSFCHCREAGSSAKDKRVTSFVVRLCPTDRPALLVPGLDPGTGDS